MFVAAMLLAPHEFRREYLLRLPLPLAQLYSRAFNAKDARSRHDNAFYLCEAAIKLATAATASCYLHEVERGVERSPTVDRQLAALALPSLGQWLGMLRELARYFDRRVDAGSHALGGLFRRLDAARSDSPALVALYRRIKNGPDGAPSGDQACSLLQVLDALVQYRNGVFGHGAARFDSFFEQEMGPLLLPAINELLADGVWEPLGPVAGRLAYITELRTLDDGRIQAGLRELVGLEGERMAPLEFTADEARELLPNRVVAVWRGRAVPLRLDPLIQYRESDLAEEVLFLNRDRNAKQVEYLSYTTGRTERDKSTAPALAALLSLVANRAVSEADLEHLAEQSLAETSSVDAVFQPAAPTGLRVGDYELLAELGRGGMGVVYLANQLSLGRLVALKTLPADLADDEVSLARFRREIRHLARCDHPNIVKVLGSGTLPDGRMYYAMEYVPGSDLEQVWRELGAATSATGSGGTTSWSRAVLNASRKRRAKAESSQAGRADSEPPTAPPRPEIRLPPLPDLVSVTDEAPTEYVRRIVTLMRDAASALQNVHDQGIVHRDIKPANLMLTPDSSRVVLMDFGLAKGGTRGVSSISAPGGFLGTLRYAAPEQLAAAKLQVGVAVDVRALGVTLWELLTRRRLFGEAEDEAALAERVLHQDVPTLRSVAPSLDRDLEAIVARACERRAADRIPTAARLAEYLQLWLDGRPLPIRTPGLGEIAQRWIHEHQAQAVTVAGAAAVVLAVVAGAFVVVNGSKNEAVDAKNRAVAAQHDTALALDDVGRAKAMLERTVAAGLLRPLAQGNEITDNEIEAYWELVAADVNVRYLFVEQAARDAEHLSRLCRRAPLAVHAAVGLDIDLRDRLEQLLLDVVRRPERSLGERLDAAVVGFALEGVSPDFIDGAMQTAVAGLDDPSAVANLYRLILLMQALEPHLDEPRGVALLRPALIAFANANSGNNRDLGSFSWAFTQVAAHLSPTDATALMHEALTLCDEQAKTGLSAPAFESWTRIVKALAPRCAKELTAQELLPLFRRLNTLGYPLNVYVGDALVALSPLLADDEASDASAYCIAAMRGAVNTVVADDAGRVQAVLAPRLQRKTVSEAVAYIHEQAAEIDRNTQPCDLLALAVNLAALLAHVEALTPDEKSHVEQMVAAIQTELTETDDVYVAERLAAPLAALAARLGPGPAQAAIVALHAQMRRFKGGLEFYFKTADACATLGEACSADDRRKQSPVTSMLVLSKVVDPETKYVNSSPYDDERRRLEERFKRLAADLTPQDALALAESTLRRIVQLAVNKPAPHEDNVGPTWLLPVLAERVDSDGALRLFESALTAIRETDSFEHVTGAAEPLAALARRMTPATALAAADAALKELRDNGYADKAMFLADALAAVLVRVTADRRGSYLDEIEKIMTATAEKNVAEGLRGFLGEAAAAVAALMEEERGQRLVQRFAAPIVETFKESDDSAALTRLLRCVPRLAPCLTERQRVEMLDGLARQSQNLQPTVLGNHELLQALAALSPADGDDSASDRAALACLLPHRVPSLEFPKFAATRIRRLRGDNALAAAAAAVEWTCSRYDHELNYQSNFDRLYREPGFFAEYDGGRQAVLLAGLLGAPPPAAAIDGDASTDPQPPPPQFDDFLSDAELVELLKQPTCEGKARFLILTQLGVRHGQTFADLWRFTAWAAEHRPELPLRLPPRRPAGGAPLASVAGDG